MAWLATWGLIVGVSSVGTLSSAASAGSATPVAAPVGFGSDELDTGWYPQQTTLTPQAVSSGTFGKLFSDQLTGRMQAQPMVVDNILLAETELNWIYGLDPVSGQIKWSRFIGTPWDASALNCSDMPGGVGVTGTPVVDPATGTEYFVSDTYASGTTGPAAWYMHAVDITSGAERPGFPVLIAGTATNDPTKQFNATYQLQRPGLLLTGGVVYAGFGGHCDLPPYSGWIAGVSITGQLTTMWTDEANVPASDTTGGEAGIWAPTALASDGPGQIIFATGNGDSPITPNPGSQAPSQLGEAVIRLSVQANGSLKPTDYFMPYDANYLNTIDGDLGSGSPVLLPPAEFGTPSHPNLAVEIGKEGYLYVLDLSDLGGYKQGPNGADNVLARLGPVGGVWGKASVWAGDGGYIYTSTSSGSQTGQGGQLIAWKYGVDGSGNPTFSEAGTSSDAFGYWSSSPIVTSTGTTSGSAILWDVWSDSTNVGNTQLRAYNPIPVNGVLQLLWSTPVTGTASKLSSPGAWNNHLYARNYDGLLVGYGIPVQTPLSGGSLSFPSTVDGTTATATATFTAAQPLTLTGLTSSSAAFTVGTAGSPTLPATLATGDTFSAPVTFRPTTTGAIAATLTVTTSAGSYTAGLSGTGLSAAPLLVATPTAVSFGGVAVNGVVTQTVTFTNGGGAPLTVTTQTPPASPFTVTGLPAVGSTIQPGQSVTAVASFAPTAIGTYTGAVSIGSDAGGTAAINLSGSSASPGLLQVTPVSQTLAPTAVGDTTVASFNVTNAGGTNLTINKSKSPITGGFSAVTGLTEGTVLTPGQTVTEQVAFSPTAIGAVTNQWVLNGDGASQLTDVVFNATATPPLAITGPSTGTWSLAGSAQLTAQGLVLTPATNYQAGSAVAPHAVATDGLTVSFDETTDTGTGADGMAFTLANPTSPTFLGADGAGLGYRGVTGTAVGLVTFPGPDEPAANFVGVADGNDPNGAPVFLSTNTTVPALQNSTHHVSITVNDTQVVVSLDGTQILSTNDPALPPRALLMFSGGTGGLNDRHLVTNVGISHQSRLAATPAAVSLPATTVGSSSTAPISITNTGDSPVVFEGAAMSSSSFGVTGFPATGTVIAPLQVITGTVTYTPTASGPTTSTLTLATDDGGLTVAVAGSRGTTIPNSTAAWTVNGSASSNKTGLQLTPATTDQIGSAFWPAAITTPSFPAKFHVQLSGGTGADGLSFAVIPAADGARSIGWAGGSFGLAGIPGAVGVVFDTFQNTGDPSGNYVGITTGHNSGKWIYAATNTTVPALRGAQHSVVVTYRAGLMTVTLDAKPILSTNVTLPPSALIGFTGATGGLTDIHTVTNIAVTNP